MTQIKLKTATHILAQPGMVTVTATEAARLCALGVAEPVRKAESEPEPAKELPKKKKKTADE